MKKTVSFALCVLCLLAACVLPVNAASAAAQAYAINGYLQTLMDYTDLVQTSYYAEYSYFYADITGDGVAELFVLPVSSYATEDCSVYGLDGSNFTYLGSFDCYYASIYAPPGENRLLLCYEEYGYDPDVREITLKNGKISERTLYAPARRGFVSMHQSTEYRYALPAAFTDVQKTYLRQMKTCKVNHAFLADLDGSDMPELIHITPEDYNSGRLACACYKYEGGNLRGIGKITDDLDYFSLRGAAVPGETGMYLCDSFNWTCKRLTYENGALRFRDAAMPLRDYPLLPLENIAFPSDDALQTPLYVSVTSQPKNADVNEGETASFSVSAQGTGLKYQWQYSKNSGGTWGNCGDTLAGYNAATLQVQAAYVRNGFLYRCKITNAAGAVVYSDAARLNVIVQTPVITKQPEDTYVIEKSLADFTVEAQGYQLKYRWQYLGKDGVWKDFGGNAATLEFEAAAGQNGIQYRCRITNSAGETVYSEPATLTVDVVKITAQPKSVKADECAAAVFSVTADGWYLSYQWQYKAADGTWTDCGAGYTGADTPEMTVAATEKRDGTTYRCLVTNSLGAQRISKEATLTLQPFGFTAQPKTVTAQAGSTAVFSVTAQGASLQYQWQLSMDHGKTWLNLDEKFAGYDTPELGIPAIAARNGYMYRCRITNSAGVKKYSEAATLLIAGMTPPFTPGDVDANGTVDSADARLALRRAVGLEIYPEGSAAFLACDVTKDNVVTAEDARLILRAAVGLETPA